MLERCLRPRRPEFSARCKLLTSRPTRPLAPSLFRKSSNAALVDEGWRPIQLPVELRSGGFDGLAKHRAFQTRAQWSSGCSCKMLTDNEPGRSGPDEGFCRQSDGWNLEDRIVLGMRHISEIVSTIHSQLGKVSSTKSSTPHLRRARRHLDAAKPTGLLRRSGKSLYATLFKVERGSMTRRR